jgi:hypothetical protein
LRDMDAPITKNRNKDLVNNQLVGYYTPQVRRGTRYL